MFHHQYVGLVTGLPKIYERTLAAGCYCGKIHLFNLRPEAGEMSLERSLAAPAGEQAPFLTHIVLTDTWLAAFDLDNSTVCVWNPATGEVSMVCLQNVRTFPLACGTCGAKPSIYYVHTRPF